MSNVSPSELAERNSFFENRSYSGNATLIDRCSKVNAYRYVVHSHPLLMREYSLYRNEYCLECHQVTDAPTFLETSCEHQLDDELSIDVKPKTGRHGVYRLSILFDPQALSMPMPIVSLADQQYHSSYQTHFTSIYPCRYFEVYDYLLHTCIFLHNEDDWRLTRSFNCSTPVVIQHEQRANGSLIFASHVLHRERGDFLVLFSDPTKLILCGERFSLLYIHHNRLLTAVRYAATIISLICLLIFCISYSQRSTLHNLPGQ